MRSASECSAKAEVGGLSRLHARRSVAAARVTIVIGLELRLGGSPRKETEVSIAENIKFDDEFLASWNAYDADRTLAVLADDVVWRDVGMPEPLPNREA